MTCKLVSRREFLRAGAMIGATGMLAACAAPVRPTAAPPAASESKPTTESEAVKPTTAPAAPGQTTVRLLTTHGATMQPFITKSLDNFAKANPDVVINHEDLTEGYYDRL